MGATAQTGGGGEPPEPPQGGGVELPVEGEPGRGPTRSRVLLEVDIPRPWLVGILAGIVVFLLIGVVGFSALNRIDTCGNCHVIKPEVDTYKQSAHYAAGVVCQDCHTKPGVFNYFIRNLQGATHVVNYISDTYQKPVTSYVGANNCVQCHPKEQIERDIVVGQIRVNHTGLREAGYQCLTCHANISHPGTQLEVARMPQDHIMSVCAKCHDGKQLPDDCELCHVNGLPSGYQKVPMTVQVKPQQCTGCHQKKDCSSCHNGLPMPHPDSFFKGHGTIVLDRGTNICAGCHTKQDPKFCIDCHGLQMPHPASWISQHDNVAAKDPKVCVKCHGTGSCMKCHGLQMPHPAGWQATHPSVARQSPGLCTKCHSPSFCTSCHGVSLPHSSSFIAGHPSYVFSNGGVCVKCHGNRGSGPNGCYGGDCHSGSIG